MITGVASALGVLSCLLNVRYITTYTCPGVHSWWIFSWCTLVSTCLISVTWSCSYILACLLAWYGHPAFNAISDILRSWHQVKSCVLVQSDLLLVLSRYILLDLVLSWSLYQACFVYHVLMSFIRTCISWHSSCLPSSKLLITYIIARTLRYKSYWASLLIPYFYPI